MTYARCTTSLIHSKQPASLKQEVEHLTIHIEVEEEEEEEVKDRTFIQHLFVRTHLKRPEWHVLTKDHAVLPATHVYPRME